MMMMVAMMVGGWVIGIFESITQKTVRLQNWGWRTARHILFDTLVVVANETTVQESRVGKRIWIITDFGYGRHETNTMLRSHCIFMIFMNPEHRSSWTCINLSFKFKSRSRMIFFKKASMSVVYIITPCRSDLVMLVGCLFMACIPMWRDTLHRSDRTESLQDSSIIMVVQSEAGRCRCGIFIAYFECVKWF